MAADFSNEPVAVRTGDAKRARSPFFRNVYANFCQGQLGPFDITLSFFQTVTAEGGVPTNEEQVTVTMSPIQFKLFAQLCTGLTDAYERTITPIVVPAGTGNPHLASGDFVKLMQDAKAKMEAGLGLGSPESSDSSTEPKSPGKQSLATGTKSSAAGKKRAKKL